MKCLLKLVLCVFLLGGLSACMTFGKKFPSETDWIVKSQTSQQDVMMVLGEPYAVGNSDGTPFWTYLYSDYKPWQAVQQKELKIYWSKGNLVKHYQFNSSFPEDMESDSRLVGSYKPSRSVRR